MKKITLLFIAATLISCGAKNDDVDTSERITDPFIGTWQSNDGTSEIVVVKSNGNVLSEDGAILETWRNSSSTPDYNSLVQTYIFDENTEDEYTETFTFSSDFNSFTCEECPQWVRQ